MDERFIYTSVSEKFVKRETKRVYALLEELTGGRANQAVELVEDYKTLVLMQAELGKRYAEAKEEEEFSLDDIL